MAAPKIATLEEIQKGWDSFSAKYELRYQPWTNIADVELQFMARLETAKSVVVPGAGPGLGGLQIREKVSPECKVIVGDLSPEMVKLAQQLFSKRGYQFNQEEACNTRVIVMDNQELPLESASCDRYVANLSVMIVPEPMKQIKESYRVLEEGGIAAFSTWGRPENSPFFTLSKRVLNSLDIQLPVTRNNFHLGKEEEFRAMFEEAGFTKVFSYYKTIRQCIYDDAEEYVEMISMSSSFSKTLLAAGEKAEQFKLKLKEEAQKMVNSGQLLAFELLMVVAIK